MASSRRPTKNERYRKTVRMAMRFGLQQWWLGKTKRFRSKEAQAVKQRELNARQAREFTETAMQMGGLVIKLGQHISTHIEFLPKEFVDELSKLQDSVAPVPTSEILGVIRDEFGKDPREVYPVFADKPIAAASLGQVHRAQLPSGDDVAVKVLRPGIEEVIEVDLASLQSVLRLADRFTSIRSYLDPDLFFGEFKTTISRELNFNTERGNADAFRVNFSDDPAVYIPRTYWVQTTQRVLTLEFVEGAKINDIARLDALGIDRSKIATELIEIYLRMILKDGFFHADPHPGNVFVRDDGTIILLDFGMVGYVPESMRSGFVDLAMAVFLKDSRQAVEALQALGFVRGDIDTNAFQKALDVFLERMSSAGDAAADARTAGAGRDAGGMGAMASAGRSIDGDLTEDLREFMYEQPFQLPDNFTFLIKALTTVMGLCLSLDPDIDLIETAKPYAQELIGFDDGAKGVVDFVLSQGKDILAQLLPTIKRIPSVIEKMDSGDMTVKLSKAQERRITEASTRGSSRVARTVFGAVVTIAGVLLLGSSYAHIPHHVTIGYVLIVIGALWMLMQMGRGRKGGRRGRAPHPTFRSRS